MKYRLLEASQQITTTITLMFAIMFFGLCHQERAFATNNFGDANLGQFGKLTNTQINEFSQNDILFYNPTNCVPIVGVPSATGDYAVVMTAKNANEHFFNGEGTVPAASWSPSDKESMRRILETYGDLAYQLGRAAGVPWIAVLAQMHFEDPQSVCGHNNFWGNGCDSNHAHVGGADEVIGEAANLGEGFIKYGETAHNGYYEEALTKTDPIEYIRALEGTWIGTGSSYAIEPHINGLIAYVESPEGQAIVSQFGDYRGIYYNEGVSSGISTSAGIDGTKITWIGDSYSIGAGQAIMDKFPGITFGEGVGSSTSYIQSNKGVSARYCGGGDANAPDCIDNPPALTILQNVINSGNLGGYLVMAVGTNGGWTNEEISEFKRIMTDYPNTKVIFVTAKARSNAGLVAEADGTNERLKQLVDSNKNYYLADWAKVAKDDYFADNSTHPTSNGGYDKWVLLIADALREASYNNTYVDSTTWEDGWIIDGFPGYTKESAVESSRKLCGDNHTREYVTDGKPNKILLHNTEGGPGDSASGLALYNDNNGDGICPAHFTVDLQNKKVYQHFSIDNPAEAIMGDLSAGVQIEIIGFKEEDNAPALPSYSAEDWEYLAKLLIAISRQTGIKLESSANWAKGASRYSEDDFKNYVGVLGHMHAPNNDHDDPGDIWSKIQSAINRLLSPTEINYCRTSPTTNGDFAATVMNFAWTISELEDMGLSRFEGTLDPKPGYKEAYDLRVSEGKYVGSLATYADCGGFVTTLMNESGYEPAYNYYGEGGNTTSQHEWLKENWDFVATSSYDFDTSILRQGDVYIKTSGEIGHTYVYVGDIDGFGDNIASASWDERVPQAGGNVAAAEGYMIYRKKGAGD